MHFFYLAMLITVCGFSVTSGFYIESTSDNVINELENSKNMGETTEKIISTAYTASELLSDFDMI